MRAPHGLSGLLPGPADADWPLFGLIDDVRPALAEMRALKAPGALATLVGVDGPSPRPLGAQMAIAPDGRAAGHLSGGCVEGNLALIGAEVAAAGAARLVTFGEGSPFMDVKLVCGARIDVLIEPIAPDDASIHALLDARAARKTVVRETTLNGGAIVRAAGADEPIAGASGARFFRRHDPTPRILILGHDAVALALAALGAMAGFETVLLRRVGPRAGPEGVDALYLEGDPRAALETLGVDAWTAVVTSTHDLDDDHDVLERALPSPAFYVGALGSRRRVADRIARLEKAGLSWEAVRRLHAPVGLDIGAATPMEIAIAILADVIRAYRAR